jgi:hypothetical protein
MPEASTGLLQSSAQAALKVGLQQSELDAIETERPIEFPSATSHGTDSAIGRRRK